MRKLVKSCSAAASVAVSLVQPLTLLRPASLCEPASGALTACRHIIEPITIVDRPLIPPEQLSVQKHYRPYVEGVLLSQGMLKDRVQTMAANILRNYKGEGEVHLLCLLKGSRWFTCQLIQALSEQASVQAVNDLPQFREHYVRVSSYKNTQTTGKVKVEAPESLAEELKGKHVLILEDIIDTGTTLVEFKKWLQQNTSFKSLAVAALLEKRREDNGRIVDAEYPGFSIPDKFVIGCSLDYNQAFRDLYHICVINQQGIDDFGEGKTAQDGAPAANISGQMSSPRSRERRPTAVGGGVMADPSKQPPTVLKKGP